MSTGASSIQFVAEPTENDSVVFVYNSGDVDRKVTVRYLQNGVYLVQQDEENVRIVGPTGPVAIKAVLSDGELFIVVNNAPIRMTRPDPGQVVISIAPNGGVIYDKVICDAEIAVDELITRDVKIVNGVLGVFMPLSRDKLFEPKLVSGEDMFAVEDYMVSTRGMTLGNTTAAFYSNIDNIEKSSDGTSWEQVSALERHKEDQLIFRSKDPDFTIEYFDTNMTDFILPGSLTTVTGDVYKVGENIGTLFSHDHYTILNGSFKVESDTMTSVSILGKLSDDIVSGLQPLIDFDGYNSGQMHLYTFSATDEFQIQGEEINIAGVGLNMEHEALMDGLVGRVEMSYADEISNLNPGQSKNGASEYSILDLQWNV